MPRVPRRLVVIPNHPHHVILRGNNRRCLFSYPREYRFFLRRVVQGSKERLVPVHTTTLMTNHVHLIVTPRGPQELSSFVRSFAQTYSQFRNRSRASSGKLFEERYKCVPIVSEEQMAITTAYIELNPVRAGISADPGPHNELPPIVSGSNTTGHAMNGRRCTGTRSGIRTGSGSSDPIARRRSELSRCGSQATGMLGVSGGERVP